ncbi:hypothetical protein H0X48_03305 [Candidatus Dependentiae bacterium]|nr:hypothetical protein [Candidatus Dependentiae bacterium]
MNFFKHIIVTIVLVSAWGSIGLHAALGLTVPENSIENFMQQLQDYKPNAPWISHELLQLSLKDFERGWSEAIDMLTRSERRWFYFCDREVDFDQERYWQQCVWQCQYYDRWLKKLYVDIGSSELIVKTIQTRLPAGALSIFEYWQLTGALETNSKAAAVHKLYMFYFDCLAHFFCQSIDLASKSKDAFGLYASCWAVSKLCLKELDTIILQFADTKWYPKYQLMLKRYQEVYALLEEEFLVG